MSDEGGAPLQGGGNPSTKQIVPGVLMMPDDDNRQRSDMTGIAPSMELACDTGPHLTPGAADDDVDNDSAYGDEQDISPLGGGASGSMIHRTTTSGGQQNLKAASNKSRPGSPKGLGPIGASLSPTKRHLTPSSASILARGPPKARAKLEATWPSNKSMARQRSLPSSESQTRQHESLSGDGNDLCPAKGSPSLTYDNDRRTESTSEEDLTIDDGPGNLLSAQLDSTTLVTQRSAEMNHNNSSGNYDDSRASDNDRISQMIMRPGDSKADGRSNADYCRNHSHRRRCATLSVEGISAAQASDLGSSSVLSDTILSMPNSSKNATPPAMKLRSPPETIAASRLGRPPVSSSSSPRNSAGSSGLQNSDDTVRLLPSRRDASMFDSRRIHSASDSVIASQGCSDGGTATVHPHRLSNLSQTITGDSNYNSQENSLQMAAGRQSDIPEDSHAFLPSLRFQRHVSSVKNALWKPGKARFAGLTTSQEYASLVRVLTEQDVHAIRKVSDGASLLSCFSPREITFFI